MTRTHFTLFSIAVFIAAAIFFTWARKINNERLDNVSCRAGYDVILGENSMNSTFIISMIRGKGTLSLLGNYYVKGIKKTPVRFYSNFTSTREGYLYSVKMTSSLINPIELVKNNAFMNMFNLSIFKENTRAIYKILKQPNGDYVFLNGGAISFTCKATQ